MTNDFHRRDVLRTGVVLGAGSLLAACASVTPRQPMTTAGSGSGTTPPVSRKPAWLDDWRRDVPAPATHAPAVAVRSRAAWASAGPILSRANRNTAITRITIHHDGMNAFASTSEHDAARRIENIRAAHVSSGWADIGYHYVIDPAGRVWEGRPAALQGAHVRDNNPNNLGILCLGNYNLQTPTAAASNSLAAFVRDQMGRYRVPAERVYTHQEIVSTQCPGRTLQAEMNRMRAPGGPIGVLV